MVAEQHGQILAESSWDLPSSPGQVNDAGIEPVAGTAMTDEMEDVPGTVPERLLEVLPRLAGDPLDLD